MKRIFSWIGSLAWIVASIFALSSCSDKELGRLIPDSTNGMADISFMAQMPATTVLTTRGEIGTVAENKIDNIYVLSFKTNGELVYKGKAKNLQIAADHTNNNKVTFKATLPVGETYDLMLLANVEDLLAGISVGANPAMSKTDVEALVLQATTTNSENGKWKTSVAIPMWDELTGLPLTSSSNPTFYLTRMMARINVEYTGAVNHFQLTSIRYYNYNTSGKVVPAVSTNMTGSGADRHAIAPTLPTDPGTQIEESLEYTAITDYKTCENLIYVFEAAKKGEYSESNNNWINNPCLVVGGKYDSDKNGTFNDEPETWYRIDFIKKTVAGEVVTEHWLSLLRNFSYNVVISSVSGDGYGDPDVALKSAPINMNAGVIDWNDGQMSEIMVDGPKFLSISTSRNEGLRRAASLYRNEGSTDEIKFSTNIPLDEFEMTFVPDGYTTWVEDPTAEEEVAGVVAKIFHPLYEVDIVEETVENGITYGKFVFTALKDYPSPAATLVVTSGRIQYNISISQRDADPNDWVDGGNNDEILGQ